jgi:hypothetical protein
VLASDIESREFGDCLNCFVTAMYSMHHLSSVMWQRLVRFSSRHMLYSYNVYHRRFILTYYEIMFMPGTIPHIKKRKEVKLNREYKINSMIIIS